MYNLKNIQKLILAVYLIIFINCLFACDRKSTNKTPQNSARLVKSIIIGTTTNNKTHSFPGRVDAYKKVDLAFQVKGKLISLLVLNGQRVKQNELLARIDPNDYQHAVEEEQAKYKKAQRDEKRYQELLKTGTIPQAAYDEKKAEMDIAKAKLATATKALNDTYLFAPFTGVIAKTFVENHENILAKQPILSLQDIAKVEIIIDVPEADLFHTKEQNKIQTGANSPIIAEAIFATTPQLKFPLRLKEYATEANPNTQTYQVKLFMVSPKEFNILPGMTAKVIVKKPINPATTFDIPATAVVADHDSNPYVWIINPNTLIVQKRQVKTEGLYGNNVRVIAGLTTGERIVTAGAAFLQQNEKIRLLEQSKEWDLQAE